MTLLQGEKIIWHTNVLNIISRDYSVIGAINTSGNIFMKSCKNAQTSTAASALLSGVDPSEV